MKTKNTSIATVKTGVTSTLCDGKKKISQFDELTLHSEQTSFDLVNENIFLQFNKSYNSPSCYTAKCNNNENETVLKDGSIQKKHDLLKGQVKETNLSADEVNVKENKLNIKVKIKEENEMNFHCEVYKTKQCKSVIYVPKLNIALNDDSSVSNEYDEKEKPKFNVPRNIKEFCGKIGYLKNNDVCSKSIVNQFCNLKITDDCVGLDAITESVNNLQISFQKKTDNNEVLQKCDLISKGPMSNSRGEASKPYSNTEKTTTRVVKERKTYDLASIRMSKYEKDFLKKITNEEMERYEDGIMDNICDMGDVDDGSNKLEFTDYQLCIQPRVNVANSNKKSELPETSSLEPFLLKFDDHSYLSDSFNNPNTKLQEVSVKVHIPKSLTDSCVGEELAYSKSLEEDCSNTSDYVGSPEEIAGSTEIYSPDSSNALEDCITPGLNADAKHSSMELKGKSLMETMYGCTKVNVPDDRLSYRPNVCPEISDLPPLKVTHPYLQNIGYVYEQKNLSSPASSVTPYPVDINTSNSTGIMTNNKSKSNIITATTSTGYIIQTTDAINNITNEKTYRPIFQVKGPQVYEVDMMKTGYDRLVEACKYDKKKKSLVVQWVSILVETERCDEMHRSLILINLIKKFSLIFGDNIQDCEELQHLKQVWREKLITCVECISQLLKNTELYVKPDVDGNTPLKTAALYCQQEPLIARCIADCIVKYGNNPDQIDTDENSLLHQLCEKGESHVGVLAELLNVKRKDGKPAFDVDCKNNRNQTPLHIAVDRGCLSVVKILIGHQAKVDMKDSNGFTPLHASLFGDYDFQILRALLQSPNHRQDVTIEDNNKNTPLILAVRNSSVKKKKQLDAIELLIMSGANRHRHSDKAIFTLADPDRRDDIKNIIQRRKRYN